MLVHSKALRLVFMPLSLIVVPISMKELSSPACFIQYPVSLIPSPIRPSLNSKAVTLATQPHTIVFGARIEGVNWSFNSHVLALRGYLFTYLVVFCIREILRRAQLFLSKILRLLTDAATSVPRLDFNYCFKVVLQEDLCGNLLG